MTNGKHTCGRKEPGPQLVQDGWEYISLVSETDGVVHISRKPILKIIPWVFNPNVVCGYINRATDSNCSGCERQNK